MAQNQIRAKSTITMHKLFELINKHVKNPADQKLWESAEDDYAIVEAYQEFFLEAAEHTERLNSGDLRKQVGEVWGCSPTVANSYMGKPDTGA